MTKIRIPEKDIQKSVLDYLEKRGVMAWRNNSGATAGLRPESGKHFFIRYGTPGSPDIIAVIEGYFVGIECKASGGKQRPDQKAFEENLLAAGGVYLLVTSFDEAIEAIEDCIRRVRLKVRPPYQRNKN